MCSNAQEDKIMNRLDVGRIVSHKDENQGYFWLVVSCWTYIHTLHTNSTNRCALDYTESACLRQVLVSPLQGCFVRVCILHMALSTLMNESARTNAPTNTHIHMVFLVVLSHVCWLNTVTRTLSSSVPFMTLNWPLSIHYYCVAVPD